MTDEPPASTTLGAARLDLPLTGFALLWRDDGTWRILNPEAEDDMLDPDDDPDEWITWTGDTESTWAHAEHAAGDSPLASWWVAYGEMPATGDVTAHDAHGNDLPVAKIGKIWALEWISRPKRVYLRIHDQDHEVTISSRPRSGNDLPDYPYDLDD
jgi:hypothetical protein